MQRALHYSHTLLDALIQRFPDGIYLDGTLGKGHDTAYILNHPDFSGQVVGFDIQAQALTWTQERLANHPKHTQVQLFQASHDQLDRLLAHVPQFSGAIYNLGYLPGGDHAITTLAPSTLASLDQVRAKLRVGGQIILVIYSGHPQGQVEKAALFDALSQWPQEEFQVLHYGFINQRNNPPELLIIERLA